jgi:DNA-directed RNA polymerase specialized sigma24 family protein
VDTFDDFPSLKELLAAASAGDERAIDEARARYNGVVCRDTLYHLRRKGCNDSADHSQGIINRAWFAILRHSNQLEDCEKFEGWINTIISNLVSEHVSGPNGCIARQQKTVQLKPSQDARIERAEHMIEANIWVNEMITLAYARSFMFGEIVRLHLVEGYTLDKVAEGLHLSLGKVRSFYYRNLNDFRKLFRDDSEDDDGDDSGGPYEH